MAIRDVKKYLYSVQQQVLDLRADIKDFDQALKDGYITEDRLDEVKDELAKIEINYQRLLYIMYLFELPQRKSKQAKYKKTNVALENYFADTSADENSVIDENKSMLDSLRKQLKELKKTADKK